MPRRVYTYPREHGLGRAEPDHHASARSCSRSACCCSSTICDAASGAASSPGRNPWDAPTLEWSTPSPPPPYNFAVIPIVASRHPLWEDRLRGRHRPVAARHAAICSIAAARRSAPRRSTREPDVILKMPGDSLLPICLASRRHGHLHRIAGAMVDASRRGRDCRARRALPLVCAGTPAKR